MAQTTSNPNLEAQPPAGGAFLLGPARPADVLTPEEFGEDTREIAAAVREFVRGEVLPRMDDLEHGDHALLVKLLKACGEQGFYGIEAPEAYGGLDLSKTAATLASEQLAPAGGFAVAFGAHSSIGMLPLVYFGSQRLKDKYLARLVSGELIGAYCLSEPGSGSDAQAAKARAVPSADGGSYTLNGTKMWISNGGFADLFTVFCQVVTDEGPKFSAFLVERDFPGVSSGREETKMGIKMSSTTQLILEDVVVPAENLLGEVGQGAKIAFNILNIGRYKLGAGGVGGSKHVLALSAKYAKERVAFGKPIAEFGLIQEKLGEMVARTFAAEAATYRVTGLIDALAQGATDARDKLKAIEEYQVEASIIKVLGSEVLAYCTDEAVQVHGGYGFSAEYAVERAYRDARINRIFEGTNEINRLLIPGALLRRAMRGQLPLLQAAQRLQAELLEPGFDEDADDAPLAAEARVVAGLKKAALLVAGQAALKFGPKLEAEEEVLGRVADIVIQAFAAESALERARKLSGSHKAGLAAAAARL
ncbi:MAG TPA: acyl-CoA dehydrogenase family protein, partial [Deinococcales bacterium]|nr:acyl-CoA dehydrogenase family protein [Deinococcales bacterium]